MSFKYENSILYEKDDIIITEYHYPEIPFLDNLENEDIIKATIFCDKRDLTKMYYKLLINEDFTYKQLYEYIITAYSRIEDDYGYDIFYFKLC